MSVSSWLLENRPLLPIRGRALDLACGRGRHALWLAQAGYETDAVDDDAAAIAHLEDQARRHGLSINAWVQDLESGVVSLGRDRYDVIVVIHYLHRPLFSALVAALRPGGVLVYETFTIDQAARGKPSNPAFLLRHGELARLVEPLIVLRERDGEFDGGLVAGVVAAKPTR